MYYSDLKNLQANISMYTTGVVLILAGEKNFDYNDIQAVITKCTVPVVGAFFPGLISEGVKYDEGYLVLHFTNCCDLSLIDSSDAEELDYSHLDCDSGTSIILLDSMAKGNQEFLNTIYYAIGNSFRFIGSGAGSLDLVQKPCIFDKEGIYKNKAIVLLLESQVKIGVKHGFVRLEGPLIANRMDASKIQELNWENAYDTYSRIVNKYSDQKITKEEFFDVSKRFPLGISRKGHDDIVRDPIMCDDDGVLDCIVDILENSALYVLHGSNEQMIDAAKDSCKEALESIHVEPTHCLFIDCVSRALYLEDKFSEEMEVAYNEIRNIYKNVPVEGVLSMGEISTYRDGRLELYNKTFLTSLIHD